MEFTQKELALIAKAGRKAKNTTLIRIILLIALLIAAGCMFVGTIDGHKLAYGLFVAVFTGIALPQLSQGPKYEDLVALLVKKSVEKD